MDPQAMTIYVLHLKAILLLHLVVLLFLLLKVSSNSEHKHKRAASFLTFCVINGHFVGDIHFDLANFPILDT